MICDYITSHYMTLSIDICHNILLCQLISYHIESFPILLYNIVYHNTVSKIKYKEHTKSTIKYNRFLLLSSDTDIYYSYIFRDL